MRSVEERMAEIDVKVRELPRFMDRRLCRVWAYYPGEPDVYANHVGHPDEVPRLAVRLLCDMSARMGWYPEYNAAGRPIPKVTPEPLRGR